MKLLLSLAACLALAGCATDPAGRYANNAPRDPAQWRVVSVTPVPAGTAAKIAARSPDGKAVEYSSSPVPLYSPAPVYAPPPVYGPSPYYGSAPYYGSTPYYHEPAYYWPPVSLSLGFVFGKHWSSGRGRGHGHKHWRGRGRR